MPTDRDRPLASWELEVIARSLGMAPSLPADQARRLLDEVVRLRAGLTQLEAQLRDLLR